MQLDLRLDYYGPPDLGLNLFPEWQQLLRDEIVPMTEEDRKILESKIYGRGCLVTLTILTGLASFLVIVYNSSTTQGKLIYCIIILFLAAFVLMCLLMKNSGIRKHITQNKKRVIITTVEKVWSEYQSKGPSKYYAEINLQPRNTKIELNKELKTKLKAGSLVELHATPETENLGIIIRELAEVNEIPNL